MQGVNSMSLDFLDADKDGRLPPSIVAIIMVLLFFAGNVTGWFAHMNWSLRGEASQIIEDMEVGDKNKEELLLDLERLDVNIEATNNDERFTNEECLSYSNSEFARSLRNNSGKEKL